MLPFAARHIMRSGLAPAMPLRPHTFAFGSISSIRIRCLASGSKPGSRSPKTPPKSTSRPQPPPPGQFQPSNRPSPSFKLPEVPKSTNAAAPAATRSAHARPSSPVDGSRPTDGTGAQQQQPPAGTSSAREPIAQKLDADRPPARSVRAVAQEQMAASENTPPASEQTTPPSQPLPDLRQGLPSTFDFEFGNGKKKCTSVDPKRMKIWMQHPPRRMALSNRGVKAAGTTINLLMKLRLIADVRCWQIICTRLCLVLL